MVATSSALLLSFLLGSLLAAQAQLVVYDYTVKAGDVVVYDFPRGDNDPSFNRTVSRRRLGEGAERR